MKSGKKYIRITGKKKDSERWDKKIPDMYKRDDSPKQNGEDF